MRIFQADGLRVGVIYLFILSQDGQVGAEHGVLQRVADAGPLEMVGGAYQLRHIEVIPRIEATGQPQLGARLFAGIQGLVVMAVDGVMEPEGLLDQRAVALGREGIVGPHADLRQAVYQVVEIVIVALRAAIRLRSRQVGEPVVRQRDVGCRSGGVMPQRFPLLAQAVEYPRLVGRAGDEFFHGPVPAHRSFQRLDEAGADGAQVARRHDENRLGALQHVHIGLLDQVFIVEIGRRADAADQVVAAMLFRRARRVVALDDDHLHILPATLARALLDDALAVFGRELRLLGGVLRQEDDHLVGKRTRFADHPHVAVGDGVEGS